MARFYGTIQGERGEATRLGNSELHVSAQSYAGDIHVDLFKGDKDGAYPDTCHIWVAPHDNIAGVSHTIYEGPISNLVSSDWRHALVRRFAEDQLAQRARG